MIELECRWNNDPIALQSASERIFQYIIKYKISQFYRIRNMQFNAICSSRQYFTLFHDLMKRKYPDEEDTQGAYIQTLLFIGKLIRKKIDSMIFGNDQFVCNKCKEELEDIKYVVVGRIEGFAQYRRQGQSTFMTLEKLKQKLVYEMKERQNKMKINCLCKKQ